MSQTLLAKCYKFPPVADHSLQVQDSPEPQNHNRAVLAPVTTQHQGVVQRGPEGVMSEDHFALYVVVYEHKGPLVLGFSREFTRHSSILVEVDQNVFDAYHLRGTPGIGLTLHSVRHWNTPREHCPRLLSMDFVAWVPKDRYKEVAQIAQATPIRVSMTWNCQDWVRGMLDNMVDANLITAEERDEGCKKQKMAINTPFTTETPNKTALDD